MGSPQLLERTTGAIVVMPDMDRARFVGVDGRVDVAGEAFITRELVDFIDTSYRTVASKQGARLRDCRLADSERCCSA